MESLSQGCSVYLLKSAYLLVYNKNNVLKYQMNKFDTNKAYIEQHSFCMLQYATVYRLCIFVFPSIFPVSAPEAFEAFSVILRSLTV